jgi:hypothetical protein
MLLGSNQQGNSVIPEAGNGLLGETTFTGGWSEHHLALAFLFFAK